MANDAFALSPISAHATPPRDEDYEALSKAFMETSRGRWFLAEYAKRNRNADIRMVLDAVARIEANQAARKSPDEALAEALAAIRGAVDEARASASAALDRSALEQSLASVRNSARVLRELSSRWREIWRRRSDLRPARFTGQRHRSRLRTDRIDRSGSRIKGCVRSHNGADRGIRRGRYGIPAARRASCRIAGTAR